MSDGAQLLSVTLIAFSFRSLPKKFKSSSDTVCTKVGVLHLRFFDKHTQTADGEIPSRFVLYSRFFQ